MKMASIVVAALMAAGPGVPTAAAQVTTLRDLAFGTIFTGTTTSVSPLSANAAAWRLQGILGLGAGFRLTLPTSLTGPGGSIPITFASSDGLYRKDGLNNPVGATTFNPHSTGVSLSTLSLLPDVYVWLGASVTPPINQPGGTYTATVVLTRYGIL